MTPYGNSGANHGKRTNPTFVFDTNAVRKQRKIVITVVMIACKQTSPLRNAHVTTDVNVCYVVDPDAFAYPAMISYRKSPGIFNIYAWLDDHTFPYNRTEESQQRSL